MRESEGSARILRASVGILPTDSVLSKSPAGCRGVHAGSVRSPERRVRFSLFVIPSEVEESLLVAFEDNEILFGADKTARIVAIELGETGTVKVYRREKDGSI